MSAILAKIRHDIVIKSVLYSDKKILCWSIGGMLSVYAYFYGMMPVNDWYRTLRAVQYCSSYGQEFGSSVSLTTQMQLFFPMYLALFTGLWYNWKLYRYVKAEHEGRPEGLKKRGRKNNIVSTGR